MSTAYEEYFRKQAEVPARGTLDSQDGQISFLGMLRVSEQGINVFRVMISDRPPLYGEWQSRFESNGYDLNVQIKTFGYTDIYNVGNLHPGTRIKMNKSEIDKVRNLICEIFANSEIRKRVNPFTSDEANFLGGIGFDRDWILAV